MTSRFNSIALCLLAGLATSVMGSAAQAASGNNVVASADTPAAASAVRSVARKPSMSAAKGPYYVDFRARTAASWGHAFVWYGKSSERAVEVAGLTPAGDTTEYMLGYITFVPSETGASYGDLDPEYLTAHYKVYLSEADAQKVFAYIKHLKEHSPVWSAQVSNCTAFIGDIANFMGLKTPSRWTRPENYVNEMKAMNGGKQVVRLSEAQ